MNKLQEYICQIERIKLLQSLDYNDWYTSEYDGEKEVLYMLLKPLLKNKSEAYTTA